MAMVYVVALRRHFPMGERPTWATFRRSFCEAGPALLTPLILVGGIVSGIFTVTEAAGIATLYSLALGFAYRTFTWRMFWNISRATMLDSATIMLIIATAQVYGFLAVSTGLPVILAEKLLAISQNPLAILMIINVILLIVGCFLETIASLTLLTPIFMPIVKQVGIDPVQFGIVMVFNLMIGLLTPPFGAVLFVLEQGHRGRSRYGDPWRGAFLHPAARSPPYHDACPQREHAAGRASIWQVGGRAARRTLVLPGSCTEPKYAALSVISRRHTPRHAPSSDRPLGLAGHRPRDRSCYVIDIPARFGV